MRLHDTTWKLPDQYQENNNSSTHSPLLGVRIVHRHRLREGELRGQRAQHGGRRVQEELRRLVVAREDREQAHPVVRTRRPGAAEVRVGEDLAEQGSSRSCSQPIGLPIETRTGQTLFPPPFVLQSEENVGFVNNTIR